MMFGLLGSLALGAPCEGVPMVRSAESGAVPTVRVGVGLGGSLLFEGLPGEARVTVQVRRSGAVASLVPAGTPLQVLLDDLMFSAQAPEAVAPRVDVSQYGSGTTWDVAFPVDAIVLRHLTQASVVELRVDIGGSLFVARLPPPAVDRVRAWGACLTAHV